MPSKNALGGHVMLAVAEAYPLAAWDKGQYHGTSPSTKATCKQRMQEIRMDSIHAMEENGDRFSDLDDTAPTIGNLPVSPCREVGAKEGTRGLGPSSSIKGLDRADSIDSGWPSEYSPENDIDSIRIPSEQYLSAPKAYYMDQVKSSLRKRKQNKSLAGVPDSLRKRTTRKTAACRETNHTQSKSGNKRETNHTQSKSGNKRETNMISRSKKCSSFGVNSSGMRPPYGSPKANEHNVSSQQHIDQAVTRVQTPVHTKRPTEAHIKKDKMNSLDRNLIRPGKRCAAQKASEAIKRQAQECCSDKSNDKASSQSRHGSQDERSIESNSKLNSICTAASPTRDDPPLSLTEKPLEVLNNDKLTEHHLLDTKEKNLRAVIEAHRRSLSTSLVSPEPLNVTHHVKRVKRTMTPDQSTACKEPGEKEMFVPSRLAEVKSHAKPPIPHGQTPNTVENAGKSTINTNDDADLGKRNNNQKTRAATSERHTSKFGVANTPKINPHVADQEDIDAFDSLQNAIKKALESQRFLSGKMCRQKIDLIKMEMERTLERAYTSTKLRLSQIAQISQAERDTAIRLLHSKIEDISDYFRQQQDTLGAMKKQCQQLQQNAQCIMDSSQQRITAVHQAEMDSLSKLHENLCKHLGDELQYVEQYRKRFSPGDMV